MNIAEEIALHLRDMSPAERTKYLAQVKRDAAEKALEDQEAANLTVVEVGLLSTEDLQDEIASYDPRKGDRRRYKKISAELASRQKVAAAEANQVTMAQSDYLQQEYKRLTLTNELERLNNTQMVASGGKPSEVLQRQREIMKELQSLPGLPDEVIEPVKEVKENE